MVAKNVITRPDPQDGAFAAVIRLLDANPESPSFTVDAGDRTEIILNLLLDVLSHTAGHKETVGQGDSAGFERNQGSGVVTMVLPYTPDAEEAKTYIAVVSQLLFQGEQKIPRNEKIEKDGTMVDVSVVPIRIRHEDLAPQLRKTLALLAAAHGFEDVVHEGNTYKDVNDETVHQILVETDAFNKLEEVEPTGLKTATTPRPDEAVGAGAPGSSVSGGVRSSRSMPDRSGGRERGGRGGGSTPPSGSN